MIYFKHKIIPWLILFIAVFIGFWQISFLVYPLKWDVIDVVFPFRYYFSECIQAGYFPFWNPYLQTGTPFYADLQVPFFYPELLYTSMFFGYDVHIMNFLFVAYILIAASGMYNLSYHFNKSKTASVVAALSYSLSGFVIGHGQHFFLLVGAAWVPFVVVSYIQLNEKRDLFHALKAAVFIFLMVTGAYQALSFTLLYLLAFIFLNGIIKMFLQRKYDELKATLKVNLILLFLLFLLCLPLIFTAIEVISEVERLDSGIDLTQTVEHGQSLKSVVSFLLPFSTLKNDAFFGGVDISMRNHYFGMITLLLFISALFKKRTSIEYIFLFFGLIVLGSIFSILPFREFLFKYIPLMNLFKYAAFLRIFALLAFILWSANYMAYFIKNFNEEKKKIIGATSIILFMLLAVILFSGFKISKEDFAVITEYKSLSGLISNMTFHQHVFFQAIMQFLIAAIFLMIVIFRNKIKYAFHLILVLIIADLIVAMQLNFPVTVADVNHKPGRMNKNLALFLEKFPLPIDSKIKYNNREHAAFQPFWRNTYIFSKQVSFQSFSSFELDSYNKLDDEHNNLKDAVLNNHLFYFSDTILRYDQLPDETTDYRISSDFIYLSEESFNELSEKEVAVDNTDQIRVVEFSPNKIVVETTTKSDQFLNLLQTNYKGWKATIDNESTPIYTSNFNYRTIFLPKGKHVIQFKFSNRKILYLYIFSNLLFLILTLYLVTKNLKKSGYKRYILISVPLFVILMVVILMVKNLSYKDRNLNTYEALDNHWSDKKPMYHVSLDFEKENAKSDSLHAYSGERSLRIDSIDEYIPLGKILVDDTKLRNGTLVVSARIFPETYTEGLIVSETSAKNSDNEWHAYKIERQIQQLNSWNRIMYVRNFYNLNEDEGISVFLWNLKGMHFNLDNVTIDFYPFRANQTQHFSGQFKTH